MTCLLVTISFFLKIKLCLVNCWKHLPLKQKYQEAKWCLQKYFFIFAISSVQSFSHVRVLRPHESQYTRPPCPSPTPRVYPNSCPSGRWCHPAISSSVILSSSCPQSLPGSRSFPMSHGCHFGLWLKTLGKPHSSGVSSGEFQTAMRNVSNLHAFTGKSICWLIKSDVHKH